MISPKEQDNKVSFKSFNRKRDQVLLKKWVKSPHVRQWWGDPVKNMQELSRPAINGGEELVIVGAKPVGYIRWQALSQEELQAAGLDDLPDSVIDIDIAIGESNYLGRGIGSQSLRLLVSRLFKSEKASMIMVHP